MRWDLFEWNYARIINTKICCTCWAPVSDQISWLFLILFSLSSSYADERKNFFSWKKTFWWSRKKMLYECGCHAVLCVSGTWELHNRNAKAERTSKRDNLKRRSNNFSSEWDKTLVLFLLFVWTTFIVLLSADKKNHTRFSDSPVS